MLLSHTESSQFSIAELRDKWNSQHREGRWDIWWYQHDMLALPTVGIAAPEDELEGILFSYHKENLRKPMSANQGSG